MKIGFLSVYSPNDRSVSSGTNYSIAQALSKIGSVKWIQIRQPRYAKFICRLVNRIVRFSGKNFDFIHTRLGARVCNKKCNSKHLKGVDVLCAFFCMQNIANLRIDIPIIYFTDATFPAMTDYYPEFSNLLRLNIQDGIYLEKKAMDSAAAVVVSSNWAAKSAIKQLGQTENKVNVIEFGANIDEKDIVISEREYTSHLDLLFLGVDWERKGGDIAVEATRWLNENGIDSTLHIVGIRDLPSRYKDLYYIKHYGYLNKNVPDEYNQLIHLLHNVHCLLLPTKAECAGIAFAEASANGLPVFTHDTGGVANYIENGKNGYMLPLGSTGMDFGKRIKETIDSGEIQYMVEQSRKIYREKLNWATWGEKVNKIISSVIRQNQ